MVWHRLQLAALLLIPLLVGSSHSNDVAAPCDQSPIEIVLLLDITTANKTSFAVQQQMLLRTIRHVESSAKDRARRYAVVVFHRTPITLLELGSPFANDSNKVISLVNSLRPRQYVENSVAKAFDAAAQQLQQYGSDSAHKVVILAHDGVNTDLVAETLEAATSIERLGVIVFAISGNPLSNSQALAGYTGDSERVLTNPAERAVFQDNLDKAIGVCPSAAAKLRREGISGFSDKKSAAAGKAFGVRVGRAQTKPRLFENGQDCAHDRADLVIVLDTSGSVFTVFDDQRKIALDLLESFPEYAYQERLQVSVVRFAARADVIIPFLKGRERKEIMDEVRNIRFTGQNTRIASAVQIAVDEMERARRKDARQIVLLISDGHGQEYWNVVQATGKRLQDTGAELFAVSASRDYNEAELLIYVGDRSRLFVGTKYTGFIPTLSTYVKGCVTRGRENAEGDPPDTEESAKHTVLHLLTTSTVLPQNKQESKLSTTTVSQSLEVTTSIPETTTFNEDPLTADNIQTAEPTDSKNVQDDEASGVKGTQDAIEGSGLTDQSATSSNLADELEESLKEVEPADQPKEKQKLRDVAQSSGSCDVDLVLIIDRSQSVDADFNRQIQTAIKAVELFPENDYENSKIRVGAVSFAKDAALELPLQSRSRSDVLKAINGIEHTGGQTSAVEGARLAMARLLSNRRYSARLVTLMFTDGHSQDYWRQLVETAMKLRESPNSVLIAFTASNFFSRTELLAWTGDSHNIFVSEEEAPFLQAVGENVHQCSGKEPFSEKANELEALVKKENPATQIFTTVQVHQPKLETTTLENIETTEESSGEADAIFAEELLNKTVNATEEPKVHGIRTATDLQKISDDIPEKVAVRGCRIDLIFVIDISTSVEAEFQQQIQFAVDLVKRLPADDFEDRVKVGLVVFTSKGQLRLKLGEITSRSSILDSLLSIENKGGSTSVASGINIAIDEIDKRKRKNARQMVVLVSDGNSQDHWDDVIRSSTRLRGTGADTYAVTASQRYMFRELELYAGDKWHVFIDARIRQFLDEVEHSAISCTTPAETMRMELILGAPPPVSSCPSDLVDLLLLIDTTSPEEKFYKEKEFAVDLIKNLPKKIFDHRLSVSIIPYSSSAEVSSQLGSAHLRGDVIYEIQRIRREGQRADVEPAVREVLKEVGARRRSQSRLVVVFVSSGQLTEHILNDTSYESSLREAGAAVYAVTLSSNVEGVEQLKHLTNDESRVFHGAAVDKFTQEVSAAISDCPTNNKVAQLAASKSEHSSLGPLKELGGAEKLLKLRDDNQVQSDAPAEQKFCKYNKLDLQIILDASASREEVFERQRELALSLIERLPISSEGAHVAVGINSFTSTPVLRQTLGLGRDKKMVRAAIESIAYHGGSTLTARAIDLSVDDLTRGKRPDAVQVVVLMNDGISQDSWDRVLAASQRLEETGAQRFGIALGDQVDLRELHHYVGNVSRIYRDGTTEKFLSDVVSLLGDEHNCNSPKTADKVTFAPPLLDSSSACERPSVDLLVLFDNTDKSINMSDPAVNSNRYLLLDVLGSLVNNSYVRVSVISFSDRPKVELDFTQISERDKIFAKVEAIRAIAGKASYSEAISVGLDMLEKERRSDARASLIIVGDGANTDTKEESTKVARRIKEIPHLSCLAVDSSTRTDVGVLEKFTGSRDTVFDYERNAQFARQIGHIAEAAKNPECTITLSDVRDRVHAATVVEVDGEHTTVVPEGVYITIESIRNALQKDENVLSEPQRDLAGEPIGLIEKLSEGKVVSAKKTAVSELSEGKIVSEKPHRIIPLPKVESESEEEPSTTRRTPRPTTTRLSTTVPLTTSIKTTPTRRPTTIQSTTSPRPLTTPSYFPLFRPRPTVFPEDPPTTFKPGCLFDLIFVLDSSGSVEETFRREKELAAGIMDMFRIGPDNARIAIIKFAASHKVKTVWRLKDKQSRVTVLRTLNEIPFTSGTTAIHAGILRAISEYTKENGARPGRAVPISILFTDGYGQKSTIDEANLLRKLIPNTFAIAINHQYPISRPELVRITGDAARVFTDANIKEFHTVLQRFTKDCDISD